MWPELQDPKLCPSTSFLPRPIILQCEPGICYALFGADKSLGKAQDLGYRGHERACGAQRHWLDLALLRGISGLGLGLLCPSLLLPSVLLMLSRKEALAWHALSSGRQLPWGAAQAEQAEPLLSIPSCRPPGLCAELNSHLSSSLFPLWCCSPPALHSATPCGCIACFHCCLARTPSSSSSSSLKPQCAQGRCWGQWGREVFWGG